MSDETAHYMESTSRLSDQNERLRHENERLRQWKDAYAKGRAGMIEQADLDYQRAEATEATMREVAEELRVLARYAGPTRSLPALADRLDPPPVVEKPKE